MKPNVGEVRLERRFVDFRTKGKAVCACAVCLEDESGLCKKSKRVPYSSGLYLAADAGAHELSPCLQCDGPEGLGKPCERNAAAVLCEVVLEHKQKIVQRFHGSEKIML